jgi:hypothetical protein
LIVGAAIKEEVDSVPRSLSPPSPDKGWIDLVGNDKSSEDAWAAQGEEMEPTGLRNLAEK